MPRKLDDKPRWTARDEKDREKMVRWVHEKLDQKLRDNLNTDLPERCREYEDFLAKDGPQLAAAAHGDLEPLRRKYPHLARFINLPRGKRGPTWRGKRSRYFLRQRSSKELQANLVRLIREIWVEYYGRKNRKAEDGPSAEEIAKAYLRDDYDPTPEQLAEDLARDEELTEVPIKSYLPR
jgi:hypothetical protein